MVQLLELVVWAVVTDYDSEFSRGISPRPACPDLLALRRGVVLGDQFEGGRCATSAKGLGQRYVGAIDVAVGSISRAVDQERENCAAESTNDTDCMWERAVWG